MTCAEHSRYNDHSEEKSRWSRSYGLWISEQHNFPCTCMSHQKKRSYNGIVLNAIQPCPHGYLQSPLHSRIFFDLTSILLYFNVIAWYPDTLKSRLVAEYTIEEKEGQPPNPTMHAVMKKTEKNATHGHKGGKQHHTRRKAQT